MRTGYLRGYAEGYMVKEADTSLKDITTPDPSYKVPPPGDSLTGQDQADRIKRLRRPRPGK